MDYAGVARLLKLDPGLREAVVAVKLQEVRSISHARQFRMPPLPDCLELILRVVKIIKLRLL